MKRTKNAVVSKRKVGEKKKKKGKVAEKPYRRGKSMKLKMFLLVVFFVHSLFKLPSFFFAFFLSVT